MKKPVVSKLGAAIRAETRPRTLIPALLAASSGFAIAPAAALELGEAQVSSTLGQPLRTTIAYTLGPNEQLDSSCVRIGSGGAASGLPAVSGAEVAVANGVISITGKTIVREPLMSMRLNVTCPYTPQLMRDYMLFIDPSQPTVATAPEVTVRSVSTTTNAESASTPASAPSPAPVARRPAVDRPPIASSTRYRVQPGDSLSQIAQRIENRPVGLWAAVGAIFDANPGAFIDNDPNRLKAGSVLTIPDFGAQQAPVVAATVFPPAEPASVATPEPIAAGAVTTSPTAASYEPVSDVPAPATTEALKPVEAVTGSAVDSSAVETPDSTATDRAALRPGDVILDSDNPFVTPGEETVTIPDTALDGPAITATSPNVPAATVQVRSDESESSSLIGWLLGGAVALIGGLLLLSQRLRSSFGSTPIGPAATAPQRRKTDGSVSDTQKLEAVSPMEADIADDDPTSENLALDADLVLGTGLADTGDADVAPDFGFAATTQIDIELPEEMSSGGDTVEVAGTDVIPPLNAELESILEREVLPDEDDEYDMSVIIDATKMPQPEDVTERDLEAIDISAADDSGNSGDYTVSQEVDYEILEQDYEDEFTATQRLNQEIARAAEELAMDLDEQMSTEDTSEMSLASVTAIDVTAQLPANDETEMSDDDDSMFVHTTADDKTVEMHGDDKTVEMSADEKTVEMSGEDKTVEMAADDKTVEMAADDETAEMPIKRGSSSR